MIARLPASFAVILLTTVPICHAALVARWSFNNLAITSASSPGSGGVPTSLAADAGSGQLLLEGWTGTVDDFAGSSLNLQPEGSAGSSLSLIAGSGSPYPGNGGTILLQFSMVGLSDLALSFATQATATGFNHNQLAWSTDNLSFTDFGATYAPAGSYALQTFDLSGIDAIDNAPNVYLRLTFNGASGATGNNRIDNLSIEAVPEPGGLWLVATAGLLLMRRRRPEAGDQRPETRGRRPEAGDQRPETRGQTKRSFSMRERSEHRAHLSLPRRNSETID